MRLRIAAAALLAVLGLPVASAAAEFATGLKLTPPDQLRGIPLAASPFAGAELPARVDLSDRMPQPGQQGHQNSCVAWTVAYALKSYQEQNENHWGVNSPAHTFSPAFLYNQLNNGSDGGIYFSDALNFVSSNGAATFDKMPYNDADYRTQPSQDARNSARMFRIDTWRQVNVQDTKEVKAQLAAGYPVMIGATIDEGLQRLQAGQTWHQYSGKMLGGHAMLIVGYDDGRSAFRVMNSWGQQWADGGFAWIDYGFFRSAVREAYVAKDAQDGAGPAPTPPPTPGPSPGPLPPPPVASSVVFGVTNVQSNVPNPTYNNGMVFQGTLQMPANINGKLQIVVRIYQQTPQGLVPVRSIYPAFTTTDGFAATGTPPFQVTNGQPQGAWSAFLPYLSLYVPHGLTWNGYQWVGQAYTSNLVAIPMLYMDDFGVGTGNQIAFQIVL